MSPGETCRTGADRKSTRLNSSHLVISYAVFCLKKKMSAPAVVVTGRHCDFVADGLFCIGNDTAGVTSARIEKHGNFEQSVLAVDHRRAGNLTDVSHLPERDLRARGSRDQYVGEVLGIAPVLRRVTHAHGKAPTPFDCCGDVVFADRSLDHILNCTHVDAVTG